MPCPARLFPRLVLGALAASGWATAPAGAAQSVIDRPARDMTLAAHGRVVAYSAWDPAARVFRLRVQVGDRASRDVPVAPRSVPFDVSVARAYEPVRGHEDVLVYSRCATEPTPAGGIAPEPAWRTARGCRLYETSFDGPERAIVGAGEGVLPSVAGGTLAFARFSPGRAPKIIVRRLNRVAPPLATFGGPSVAQGAQGPAGVAVYANRVAVTWRYHGRSEGEDNQLLAVDLRRHTRTLVRKLGGGGISGHAIVGATWLGDQTLHWGEICAGDPGGCPGRTRYGSWQPGHPVELTAAPLRMRAYATTALTAFTLEGCPPPLAFTESDNDAPCELVTRSPAPLITSVP